MNASASSVLVPVVFVGGNTIQVDCPNGWDDVNKLRAKVLEFDGRNYCFTGWNSDRNVAFFKSGAAVAKIVA